MTGPLSLLTKDPPVSPGTPIYLSMKLDRHAHKYSKHVIAMSDSAAVLQTVSFHQYRPIPFQDIAWGRVYMTCVSSSRNNIVRG